MKKFLHMLDRCVILIALVPIAGIVLAYMPYK